MRIASLMVVLLFAGFICACDDVRPTADMQQQARQERMQQEQVAETGMPNISNFTEVKLVKHLYELRDSKVATYSYLQSMDGKLWHLCDSIGYGLPYGVQFSNPEKITSNGSQVYGTLPQSEPNGLYMPTTAEGTWIMCANDKGGTDPVYVEPRVIVSPFKLRTEGEYAVR